MTFTLCVLPSQGPSEAPNQATSEGPSQGPSGVTWPGDTKVGTSGFSQISVLLFEVSSWKSWLFDSRLFFYLKHWCCKSLFLCYTHFPTSFNLYFSFHWVCQCDRYLEGGHLIGLWEFPSHGGSILFRGWLATVEASEYFLAPIYHLRRHCYVVVSSLGFRC